MLDCISVENMRLSDDWTIRNRISSLELMYRAARGVFRAVTWYGNIAILTGSGNNGGDGYALACILKDHGFKPCIFTLSERISSDSAFYAEKATAAGISIQPFQPGIGCLMNQDIVVDCLLGTGFRSDLRRGYQEAIQEINQSKAYIVSVDINSGMNGDTGESELAVHSDMTVTIGYVKNGLITHPAETNIKKLICTDIGIVLQKEETKLCSADEWILLKNQFDLSTDLPFCHNNIVYRPYPSWLDGNIISSTD